MKCRNCGKELKRRRNFYCSSDCQREELKRKISHKKAVDKFRTEKKEQFNKSILKAYRKNKDEWNSRSIVYRVLKCKRKPSGIIKSCKECGSENNLGLKFEVYPLKTKDIRNAIKQGRIYYLCKECKNERTKTTMAR